MEISIWSDIRCPFCYIGKRRFEEALGKFEHADKVNVVWKSFELDPNLQTRTDIGAIDHFCESKGVGREQAMQMFNGAAQMAKEVGIDFKLDQSVPANSLKAHRLMHYAQSKDKSGDIKEALFNAHLVAGKNIDDIDFLVELASANGLNGEEVRTMLQSEDFTYEVRQDQMEARNLGVSGVPFFVLNSKYGVSGAQPTEVFLDTLEKAWENHLEEVQQVETGGSCDIDGNC
ncbi:DsbA family oxidoreductase [Arenibacter certesii]|uniref:DSBA oxidoreductase n=1 Tax=Arenibacter certesii TaxID=228955 RepID=A0A918MN13_9FLAO|nr:DsbA family oxidoreductase [Arenibacter certesii]GGW38036.1 DSBA oxidoreductase [Arenibacter certesii]